MKRFFLLLTLISVAVLAPALILDHYTFNPSMGTYAPITGTVVASVHEDDALSTPIDIGFTFPYGSQNYTQIKICSNGWIGLGTTITSQTYTNELSSTTYCPVLAPLWDDLNLTQGSVQYILAGTTPNRVFTVQFEDAHWDYSATNQIDLQIKLFESGKIQFVYGPADGNPTTPSASIGINMLPGGTGWYYSVTPGSPATASTTTENSNIIAYPGVNTVYSFEPAVSYPDDLAGVSVTGDITPVVGTQNTYTVTIRNQGTNPQSTYQVRLYRASNVLVGSVDGTTIQPGENLDYTFQWTPTAAGAEILTGRVVLTDDDNIANDATPGLNVTIQMPGTFDVTIGDGSQAKRVPMDFYWKNSLFECIYYASELNFTGTINALEFYNNFSSDLPTGATKIWLGITTDANLSAGWITAGQLTQVFDGTVNYPAGLNVIMIELTTPFDYSSTAGNLVMLVYRPFEDQYWESTDYFLAQTDAVNIRARKAYSDSIVLDPTAPPADGVPSGEYPKTKIIYYTGSAEDDPSAPEIASMLRNVHPNPFGTTTSIDYTLKSAGIVRIDIFNLKGQLVKTLVEDSKVAGTHTVAWDGKDLHGKNAASGIYFCRMTAGADVSNRKLMLLK